jgi:hypothetical protein
MEICFFYTFFYIQIDQKRFIYTEVVLNKLLFNLTNND